MNFMRSVLTALCVFGIGVTDALSQDASNNSAKAEPEAGTSPFLVKPYLQAGHVQAAGQIVLVWQTHDTGAAWTIEYRPGSGRRWQAGPAPSFTRVAVAGIEPHRIYHAALAGLEPGQIFAYRVSHDGKVVFESDARAPKAANQPYRFVVFGDCGADTPAERAIAFRTFRANPDFVMITGDIVYGRGLVSEYRTKFWPIYNAQEAAPEKGAPLLRSTLFLAAPGNHDIASRDLGKDPGGLAYFYYWLQPLNGPMGEIGGPITAALLGPDEKVKAFRDAAGGAFPRMANFSVDYGNGHWTVLDANATVDWTNRELRDWVAADLAAAAGAGWRFVSFHQPGFNSSKSHFDEQYMRILAPFSRRAMSTSCSTDTSTTTSGRTRCGSCPTRMLKRRRLSGRREARQRSGMLTASSRSTRNSTDRPTPRPKASSTLSPAQGASVFIILSSRTTLRRGRNSLTSTYPRCTRLPWSMWKAGRSPSAKSRPRGMRSTGF